MRSEIRSWLWSVMFVVPACNVVVLAEDTEASTSEFASTTADVPTGGFGEAGAGDETGAPGETGAPVDGSCDFAGEIQPIFTASCGCHGGGQPAQGLSLAEGSAYASLVGVASAQQPALLRVEAGAPDASYLLHKLQASPPVGERMPVGGALAAEQVARISAWIAAGAPETEAFACAGGTDVGEVGIDVAGPIEVKVGEILQVSASVADAGGEPLPDAALTWSSSAELALYVDGSGVLLGVSPGTAELRAHSGGVDSAPVMVTVVEHRPDPATFTQVRAITDARCAVAGCHVDGVEPGDLRFDRDVEDLWEELLEDEAAEVDELARVEPGAPEASYMVQKLVLHAPPAGAQMPIGGAPMPAAEVQTIVRWIRAGAAND